MISQVKINKFVTHSNTHFLRFGHDKFFKSFKSKVTAYAHTCGSGYQTEIGDCQEIDH